jgi:curved DNA-binding protein CbpA
MARTPNYYCNLYNIKMIIEVLGLKSDSSEKDIKSAYFKLAKKYHPDLNPNQDARDKFDKISKYLLYHLK